MKFQKNLNNNIIGPSKKYTTPIALDPVYYEGAIVYGDDGRLFFSDGVEWKTPSVDVPPDVWVGNVDLNGNNIQGLTFSRKTTGETNSYVGENGEITIDTTKNTLVVHNGSAGGNTLVSEFASQTISNKTLNLQDSTIIGLNGPGLSLSGSQLSIDDSVVLTVDDNQTVNGVKTFNEEISVNNSGGIKTNQSTFNIAPQNATEVNIATAGTDVAIASAEGQTTINNNLVVGKDLIVTGSTVSTSTDIIILDDKILSLLDLSDSDDPEPSDSLADGGGIQLNGTTTKEFKWFNQFDAWTSSENIDMPSDKSYLIDGNEVLSSDTLGSTVVNSSIQNVGTLSSGTWQADTISPEYGGTGQTTYIDGQLLIGNTVDNTLTKARLTEGNGITILNGNGAIEISNGDKGSDQNIFKNIVDENDNIQFSADNNNDNIKFEGSGTVTISFDTSTNSIVIDSPEAVLIPGDGITVSSNTISVDGTVVQTSGNQTISGTKSFTDLVDADITGNAGTTTALQNPVTINGVSFDGTENIEIGITTDEVLTAGDGISGGTFNGSIPVTFDNIDKGSSQNIFKNVVDNTDTIQFSANNNTDSLKFVAGLGTQINFDSSDNSITFIATGDETAEPDIFRNIADSAGSIQFFADGDSDTVRFTSTGLADVSFDIANKGVNIDTPSVGDGLIVVSNELGVDNTVVRTSGNQTINGTKTFDTTIVGDINGNADTASSLETAVTINGVSFDGTENITVPNPQSLSAGDGIAGTPFDGSTATIFNIDNTVVRTSGNQTISGTKTFDTTIVGDINGNADTATALETPRNINGVSFDGTADITLSISYNDLTDTPTLFSGSYNDLTDTPTTLAGYGIIDAATSDQGELADTAVQPADLDEYAQLSSAVFTGQVTLQQTSEKLIIKQNEIINGLADHDFSRAAIWYHSSIPSDFTANFNNVPTTADQTINVVLVLEQGATGYLPNAVQINTFSQTINWINGLEPTPTGNGIDVVSFTFIRTSADGIPDGLNQAWTVLGSLTSYS